MNCPECGVWSSVLETRRADRGYLTTRSRECANGHRFKSYEVSESIYHRIGASRAREATNAAEARAFRHKRNQQMLQACKTRSQTEVAAEFGVSQPWVSRLVRAAARSQARAAADAPTRAFSQATRRA